MTGLRGGMVASYSPTPQGDVAMISRMAPLRTNNGNQRATGVNATQPGSGDSRTQQRAALLVVLGLAVAVGLLRVVLPRTPPPLDQEALYQCDAWYAHAYSARDSLSVATRIPSPQARAPRRPLRPCAALEGEYHHWKAQHPKPQP